ncbi:MAG: hypothetical protein ACI8XM_000449 [Haloarculaceae archaeon]|jgi:hypothetical protein
MTGNAVEHSGPCPEIVRVQGQAGMLARSTFVCGHRSVDETTIEIGDEQHAAWTAADCDMVYLATSHLVDHAALGCCSWKRPRTVPRSAAGASSRGPWYDRPLEHRDCTSVTVGNRHTSERGSV